MVMNLVIAVILESYEESHEKQCPKKHWMKWNVSTWTWTFMLPLVEAFFLDLWAVLCQFSSEFGQNSCGFCSELTNAQKDRNLDSRISDGFFVPYLIVLSFNCHFWKTDSQVSSSIVINTDVRKITQHTPSTKQTRMTKKRITRKCSVMVFWMGQRGWR